MESYDLIVVGAGPSGLFAALNSRMDDGKVLVLEKGASPGKKLLISGSGQCNLTHAGEISSFLGHYGPGGRFLRPALFGFDNQDLMAFFEARGLAMTTSEGGKVFPKSLRSRDLLDVLMEEGRFRGVSFRFGEAVTGIGRRDGGFDVTTEELARGSKRRYRSRFLVIATGGMSYPSTGSTGEGYRFAERLGHRVVETAPSLTPVYVRDFPFSDLAGISFSGVEISLYRGGRKAMSRQGDLLFTHRGLSGPGILDFSRYIREGDVLKVSFVGPGEEFSRSFSDALEKEGRKGMKAVITGLGLPERLAARILEISGVPPGQKAAHLSRRSKNVIEKNLTAFPMVVESLGGFDVAMVTRGGVDRREVNPRTMESRLVPDLYFVGEVLDVDGDTGGYNIQAAFSTAMLAAREISRRRSR